MKTFIAFFSLLATGCGTSLRLNEHSTEVHDDRFYYFGYGSNMLAKRIHIQNPTAELIAPVKLEDYRLDFASIESNRWAGAVATIVATKDALTWGTLWDIKLVNLPDIDNQEGVNLNLYRPITVRVKDANETETAARAYVLVNQPEGIVPGSSDSEVPEDRKPSKTYLQVLVKGAIESGLPQYYVDWLRKIKHNNRTVTELEELLDVKSVELF